MFADLDQSAKAPRDPFAPAKRAKAALAKVARHTLDDGTPAHSFATLTAEPATIVRNTCRTPHTAPDAPTFEVLSTPNAKQEHASGGQRSVVNPAHQLLTAAYRETIGLSGDRD